MILPPGNGSPSIGGYFEVGQGSRWNQARTLEPGPVKPQVEASHPPFAPLKSVEPERPPYRDRMDEIMMTLEGTTGSSDSVSFSELTLQGATKVTTIPPV